MFAATLLASVAGLLALGWRRCDVTSPAFGAVGDGVVADTLNIRAALEACDEVLLPKGKTFLSGQCPLVASFGGLLNRVAPCIVLSLSVRVRGGCNRALNSNKYLILYIVLNLSWWWWWWWCVCVRTHVCVRWWWWWWWWGSILIVY